jgi:hypothetical protein
VAKQQAEEKEVSKSNQKVKIGERVLAELLIESIKRKKEIGAFCYIYLFIFSILRKLTVERQKEEETKNRKEKSELFTKNLEREFTGV